MLPATCPCPWWESPRISAEELDNSVVIFRELQGRLGLMRPSTISAMPRDMGRKSSFPWGLAFVALAAGLGGCAKAQVGPETNGSGGGDLGGGTGEGGEGPPSLCDEDCSKIGTPQCLVAVCNDGSHIGPVGDCVVVNAPTGTPCDDEKFCTIDEVCDAGECGGGTENTCGLEIPDCREVQCVESTDSCKTVVSADGGTCALDDLCVVNATCKGGECFGEEKDCSFAPVGDCQTAACDPDTGLCVGSPDTSKNGSLCDGDPCEVNQTCSDGVCSGVPKNCSSLTVGCEEGVCEAGTGDCITQTVPVGDSCAAATDECNVGICNANGTCTPVPLSDGTGCDDFNSCTTNDECASGSCVGNAVVDCKVYFESTLESCPGGWTMSGDWQCGLPTSGPHAAHEGTGCLATNLVGDYSAGQSYDTSYAQSPPINLTTATNPVASFWMWLNTEGGSFDGMNLKVSTNGGTSFTTVTAVDPPYDLTVNGQPAWGDDLSTLGWRRVVANLSEYAGQQVILRASFRSDTSGQYDGVYLDDWMVGEGASIVPVAIKTTSVSDGYVGYAYNATLAKSGGSGSALWSIVGGSNHAWLTLNPTTGALSGSPTVGNVGPVQLVVRLEEPAVPSNAAEKTLNFSVGTALYFETFEGVCPNGYALGGDWDCGTPSGPGPGSAFQGTQCLATVLSGNYANGNDWDSTTATSGAISLVGATSPTLRFQMWVHTEGSVYDGANLKISANGGATFSVLSAVTPAYTLSIDGEAAWGGNQSAAGWQQVTADLSAYAGQSVFLQFAFRSDTSSVAPGVYIDNLVISD